MVAKLPFYENIKLDESKDAKLVEYNPIGRSSSLYSYTGAESRKLKLEFALTLPHLNSVFEGSMWRFDDKSLLTKEHIRELFLNPQSDTLKDIVSEGHDPADPPWYPTFRKHRDIRGFEKGGIRSGSQGWGESGQTTDILDAAAAAGIANPDPILELPREDLDKLNEIMMKDLDIESDVQVKKMRDYVAWWVNLVRSSVLNNQDDMSKGPPIIRLTHGTLYQDIPCVCKSYSVKYDERAGFEYHLESAVGDLISRRIIISMDLREFRVGDLETFERGVEVKRDNVTGWESIIKHSTTDPGRSVQTK